MSNRIINKTHTYKVILTLTAEQWDALKGLVYNNEDHAFESCRPSDPNRKMAHELYEAVIHNATLKTK